jgi:hypothetical protein
LPAPLSFLYHKILTTTIMTYFKILAILVLTSSITFYGCNSNTGSASGEATDSLAVSTTSTLPNGENPALAEPAQNAEGVWHYTCAKGCVGGSGTAGTCAVCGGPLTHNTVYHGNPGATTPTTTTTTPSSPIINTPAPAAEPAQNAAGVWHYTCAKGCPGGSGTAGTCGTCGGALAHNPTYHQ